MKITNRIRNYTEFITESLENYITLNRNDILFHGTSEDYDTNNIRGGGYDNILWTAKDSVTAQTYIPVSGSSMGLRSSDIYRPSKSESIINLQRKIGIEYDISEFNYENNRVISYKTAPVFVEMSNEYNNLLKKYTHIRNEVKEISNTQNISKDDNMISELKSKMKQEKALEKQLMDTNLEKQKERYVNSKLKELGYKPTTDYGEYDTNKTWNIKFKRDEVLRGDESIVGKLVILEVKEEMKIYDMTLGETTEGDLMNLDYHKINLFRELEDKGYDGVKINDFLQSEVEGNIGHTSIGIFKDSINKLKVKDTIDASHPKDLFDRYRNHNAKSIEYEKYLNKK